jgi:two-component system nitrate/nitrite response regulator NarP
MTNIILIVDDHPMIRSAVAMLLEGSDFSVVGSAATAALALDAIGEHDPDMVILDIAMPGGSGLDVLRQLRGQNDNRPVVILTAHIDDFRAREAIRLNVNGIVMKDNDPAFLIECLQTVLGGRQWLDPELKERIGGRAERQSETALSSRERQLVALVAMGRRNRQIATELAIRATEEGLAP